MNKKLILRILFIVFIINFQACQSQCHENHLMEFKEQLTKEAFNPYFKNSPFPFCDKIASDIKYQAHFETFGNCGINVLYKVENNSKILDDLKKYRLIESSMIVHEDSSYVYKYRNLQSKEEFKIPEIDSGILEYCEVTGIKDSGIKIYIIETGVLDKVFIESELTSNTYKFVSGVYYLENESKIIYFYNLYN